MNYQYQILVTVLACICLAGCAKQPQRVHVSGTVLIDGKPLTRGSIRFFPEKGRPVSSEIMSDGSYELSESSISAPSRDSGVLPGRYRVAVSAPEVLDEQAGKVLWHSPSKYADFLTSGIVVNIDGPKDDLLIELTWEGNAQDKESLISEEEADTQAEAAATPLGETDQEGSADK
jgi:hypothetical protein